MKILLLIVAQLAGFAPSAHALEVHGHRGARAVYPENTLPAFQHAMDAGADYIELDVGVTRDDEIVVHHDMRISAKNCMGPFEGSPLLRELTLAEIKLYDCGGQRNPRFPNQQSVPYTSIPTLHEVFARVKAHPRGDTVRVNVEIKINAQRPAHSLPHAEFARRVWEVVRQHGMEDRVLIQSFDARILRETRKLDPNVKLSYLTALPLEDWVGTARALDLSVVAPFYMTVKPRMLRKLQAAGFKVVPWTVNKKGSWRKLIRMGVDGIITDDPAALIRMISEN